MRSPSEGLIFPNIEQRNMPIEIAKHQKPSLLDPMVSLFMPFVGLSNSWFEIHDKTYWLMKLVLINATDMLQSRRCAFIASLPRDLFFSHLS